MAFGLARAKLAFALTVLALVVVAIGAQSAPAQTKTLRVKWTANGNGIPVVVADKLGIYKKYGLDVKLSASTGGTQDLPTLGRNFDIITATITDILAFNAKGGHAVALTSTIVQNKAVARSNPNLLVEKGINSLKQLKGKSICLIEAGAGQQWVTMYIALAKAGLNPKKDVKFVTTPAPNTLDALRAGRCDAATAVAPYLNQIKADGRWSGLINTLLSVAPRQTGSFLVTSKKLTQKDPKTYRAFQKSYAEAVRYCKANVAACTTIAMDELAISRQTAAAIQWNYMNPTVQNRWITDYIKPMQRYGLLAKKAKLSTKDNFVFK